MNHVKKATAQKLGLLLFTGALVAQINDTTAPGQLVSSFGDQGISSFSVDYTNREFQDFANAVITDADDNILLAGYNILHNTSPDNAALIARYTPDGQLDPTFADKGVFEVLQFKKFDDIKIDSQGRIVVSGLMGPTSEIVVVRLNNDGTLDTEFGNAGVVHTQLSDTATQYSLRSEFLLGDDDSIIVAGSMNNGSDDDIFVLKLSSDGSLDNNFAEQGLLKTDISGSDEFFALARDNDGKLLIAGATAVTEQFFRKQSSVFIARYNSDGLIDASFADNGVMIDTFGAEMAFINDMTVDSSNNILVVGPIDDNLFTASYHSNGQPNTSYGDGGLSPVVISDRLGSATHFNRASLVTDSQNRILIGLAEQHGMFQTFANNIEDVTLLRLLEDGALDTSFADTGVLVLPIANRHTQIGAMTLNAQEKLVVAGDVALAIVGPSDGLHDDSLVIQFDLDGVVDTDFGESGAAINNLSRERSSSSRDTGTVTLKLANKQLMTIGMTAPSPSDGTSRLVLSRLDENGQQLSSFGDNGLVLNDLGFAINDVNALLDPVGNILVVASGGTEQVAVLRYAQDGQLDSTFGDNGINILTLAENQSLSSITLQTLPDVGAYRILLGLSSAKSTQLQAISQQGQIDNTFGTNGGLVSLQQKGLIKLFVDNNNQQLQAFGAMSANQFATEHFTVDGAPDLSQVEGGIVTFDPQSHAALEDFDIENISTLTKDANGNKLVMFELVQKSTGRSNHMLLKLDHLGYVDPSFSQITYTDTAGLSELSRHVSDMTMDIDGRLLISHDMFFRTNDTGVPVFSGGSIQRLNQQMQTDTDFGLAGFSPRSDYRYREITLDSVGDLYATGSREQYPAPAQEFTQIFDGENIAVTRMATGSPALTLANTAAIRLNQGDIQTVTNAMLFAAPVVPDHTNIRLATLPTAGVMFIDANSNNTLDDNESVVVNQSIDSNVITANQLKYAADGAQSAHFQLTVDDNTSADTVLVMVNPAPVAAIALDDTIVEPTLNISFGEWVEGFAQTDLQVENAEITSFSDAGSFYRVQLTITESSAVKVTVPVGVASDINGAPNSAAVFEFDAAPDTTPPSVAIEPTVDTVSTGPITFSVSITDADTIHLTEEFVTLVTTGDAQGSISIENADSASPSIVVSDISGNGTLKVVIDEGVATDNAGNLSVAIESATVSVKNNRAPTIAGAPTTSINQDAQYQFTPSADDADTDDVLTFSISNKPDWATFNSTDGSLTGIPSAADVGSFADIVISVTDSSDATASLAAFSINVVAVVSPVSPPPPASSGGSGGGAMLHYYLMMLMMVLGRLVPSIRRRS